jgi:hypothetical protein
MSEKLITNTQVIPEDVIAQAIDFVRQGYGILLPYLLALTPDDRKKLLKMADGTEPFVSQSISYMGSNKQLVPNFVDVDSVASNYATFEGLSPLGALLTNFASQVSDTRMVAGSTAFSATLSFYDSIKLAAGKRIPGAKTIYEDLKKRFAKKKKKTDKVEGTNKPDAGIDAVA